MATDQQIKMKTEINKVCENCRRICKQSAEVDVVKCPIRLEKEANRNENSDN